MLPGTSCRPPRQGLWWLDGMREGRVGMRQILQIALTLLTVCQAWPPFSHAGSTASLGTGADQCLTVETENQATRSLTCLPLRVPNGSLTNNTSYYSLSIPVTPVSIANGGTNSSTALSGSSIMVSNGSAIVQGQAGTTTTLLHGNAGGTPTYSAASLTADVAGILPIANGGTNNNSTYTAGSVIFSNGTSLTQNNASFFWDNSTNRLGIGTTAPAKSLDVSGVIVQRPAATNSFANYVATNADAAADTTNLNPGILFYSSGTASYGIDLGYSSTAGRFRTRVFSQQDITLSTGTGVTGQSGFTDQLSVRGDTGRVGIGTVAPATLLDVAGTVNATGAVTLSSTLTSSATGSLGWSVVAAANQACNTTCTSACVFGEDTSVLGSFVDCADATADRCLCAGAS